MKSSAIPPQLTPQQQAIVAHNEGPALVFAVAGAGKTTAMVQRIARLVREGIFAPEQILATSFNKAANEEIVARLKTQERCARVEVKTLHALGYLIVREASQRNLVNGLRSLSSGDGIHAVDRQLFYKTLTAVRSQRVRYADELDRIDQEDFLTYVGACKGNLHYADLAAANLSPAAQRIAQQARPPAGLTWYLDLYRHYERIRQQEGLLTFDDLLMTGWEILTRHEAILARLRKQYRCLLVDEFQDINLAQAEVLDLLSWPDRHYMAIGDDDQTIYEWRGASPRFILGFAERYGARVYDMNENFRSKAPQLVLANRVIEHNKVRHPKQLGLTQGFDGQAYLHLEASNERMGKHIAEEISTGLRAGYRPSDFAVLVRIYAQTPPIEQFLITHKIPYQIVGGDPFYERSEVRTLLAYCQIAEWEASRKAGVPFSAAEAQQWRQAWLSIYNQPTRYLSRQLADKVAALVTTNGLALPKALDAVQHEATDRQQRAVGKLAEDLRWVSSQLAARRSAEILLRGLEDRLQYMRFVRGNSNFPETGAAKAASIATLLDYAARKGTLPEFLRHLEELATARATANADPNQPQVTITTMFRAKGLEWPIVFVPNCNQGTLPYERMASLEEERRLLYVAITRARHVLHLHALRNQPLSQFLEEANTALTLTQVQAIQRALSSEPKAWRVEEMVGLTVQTQRLGLQSYFRRWWGDPPARKQRLARLALRILASIERHELGGQLQVEPTDKELWQTLLR